MIDQSLYEVLEATGYLADGHPAHGVRIGDNVHVGGQTRGFRPDALWKGDSALTVYFKSEPEAPSGELIAGWHREIWNQGFAPLLWVISPEKIDLYNGFGRPRQTENAAEHWLRTFERIESKLEELDAFAGRLAMETGRFWQEPDASKVDRKTSVDRQLLSDLAALERDLVAADMSRPDAQGLIGRSIFTQYLIDRRIVTTRHLANVYGHNTLAAILRDRRATKQLFDWLRETFNGDMFPSKGSSVPRASHLRRVADFLDAVDPDSGQMPFFPYQFDVIPVELISSIYEQFARSDLPARDDARPARSGTSSRGGHHETDVFYTRLPLVSLVLDEITDRLTGNETVLDLTCGSGVFLVEALRRLVHLRSGGAKPNRRLIRSTLYKQIYGVDISEAAVRVAAFSLYLAALELDPNPSPPRALKFKPLIGKTLIVGDARNVEQTADGQAALTEGGARRRFDVIVGNPPWSYGGKKATAARRDEDNRGRVHAPRGESLGFVSRAMEFASDSTRFGLILSAVQFFGRSGTGAAALRQIIETLSPVTLVNLSNQSDWLFPNASMPAIVLFARHRRSPSGVITTVQIPWSPGGARSHTFEIAPSDIVTLPLADWRMRPEFLKAALFGCRRDLALLDRLTSKLSKFRTLEDGLNQKIVRLSHQDAKRGRGDGSSGKANASQGAQAYLPVHRASRPHSTQPGGGEKSGTGVRFRAGLKLGNRSRDASILHEIPYLTAKALRPFSVPTDLSSFDEAGAEGPRSRDIYRAPLLLVKRFLLGENVRPVVAVADRDTVFTDAFLGTAFLPKHREVAHLLAAVLSSSLASWFLLMTASTFGLWMRLIERGDLVQMPIPDLEAASRSEAGRRLIHLSRKLQRNPPRDADWQALDDAVFDLYGLDEAERTVARDGLFRASWQWKPGRLESARPAPVQPHMLDYARTFLATMHAWFAARRRRHMRAEVFDLPESAPLRVVRFVLEEEYAPAPPRVDLVEPEGSLRDVLNRIGRRLDVRLATSLSGQRELRVHGRREVVIIKPSARRHWMGVSALEDADAVIVESFSGVAA